jgi:hypothetical protein
MRPTKKHLFSCLSGISSLALILQLSAAGAASAAQLPFPPPPIFVPPPPPCISTEALFEFPGGCFTCQVRNATTDNYGLSGITIELRNEQNQVDYTTGLIPLGPGMITSASFCSEGGFNTVSCVVTTGVGSVAALRDFTVIEQFAPGVAEGGKVSTNSSSAEADGKIFNSCAPAGPSANTP